MNFIPKHSIELERKTPYDINCTVSYSAPMEALFCLNALLHPQDFPSCRFWLRRKYETLSPELLSEILYFHNHYNLLFVGDLVEYLSVKFSPSACTVASIVSEIKAMDPVDFTYIVLGFSAFRHNHSHIEQLCANPDNLTEADLGEQKKFYTVEDIIFFLKHIPTMQQRLSWIIEQFWEEGFKSDWKIFQSHLHLLAEKEKEQIETKGIVSYVHSLHPKVSLKDGAFIFSKDPDFSIPVKEITRINVSLSFFIRETDLAVNIIDDTLYVTRCVNLQAVMTQSEVPAKTLNLLKACADETRLTILRILYNGEATTQSLSQIMMLSPSAISIHLRQLKDANLVLYRKEKKYVYYRLNLSSIENLQQSMLQYIAALDNSAF